jgi:hypothetical protein
VNEDPIERRTMRGWAARLSAPDEPLTLAEARTLAAIAQADRLVELREAIADLRARMTRLELYLAATVPGYDPTTRALAAELAERASG